MIGVALTVTVSDNGSAIVGFTCGVVRAQYNGRFVKSAALVDIK